MGNGVSLQWRVFLNFTAIASIALAYVSVAYWMTNRIYRNRLRVWEAVIVARRGDFNTLCFAQRSGLEITPESVLKMRGADLAILHADNPMDKDSYPSGLAVIRAMRKHVM